MGNTQSCFQSPTFGLMDSQASLNVTQAIAAGQLCESHVQELVEM
jgi:hypothetical protein